MASSPAIALFRSKLRVQALALTRNRASADDLVQDSVANVLAAQESFTLGTNFAAWMHRILRNRFISTLRKQRDTTDIEDLPMSALAAKASHESRMLLKEVGSALDRLPSDQREALFLVVLQGLSYEDVALIEPAGAVTESQQHKMLGVDCNIRIDTFKIAAAGAISRRYWG